MLHKPVFLHLLTRLHSGPAHDLSDNFEHTLILIQNYSFTPNLDLITPKLVPYISKLDSADSLENCLRDGTKQPAGPPRAWDVDLTKIL